ncbi:transposase [Methanocella sp. MCL-LM]|uniref:transposase n=1 Tax=Methanocella sp. MCL-LM TaxID=3412035 RepID=UPI003C72E1BE
MYYGEKTDYVSSTVKTRGRKTNEVKVLSFATISIVARRFKFTLAVFPIRNSESKAQLVEKLLWSIPGELRVHAILMDKGFYLSEVMQTVDRLGYTYIIPCKQYQDLDHLYTFLEVSGEKHWRYTMHRGRPKEYTFDVYLDDQGIQRYIGFATNMDMANRDFDTLATVYRSRWNIENGYKEAKEFRIKTNSRNHGYRVLVFAISHLMMNLYTLTKRANKRAVITLTDMKDALEHILEFLMPVVRPAPDRLSKHLVIVW